MYCLRWTGTLDYEDLGLFVSQVLIFSHGVQEY